ncbi:acrB/AcrD/AcrF family protein, partial [Vibrio parahaemolyticus V-223/04]
RLLSCLRRCFLSLG